MTSISPVTPGKDHDNYIVAPLGDAVEMTTELADWSPPRSGRAMASLACDHGEGHGATPRRGDFVITSDGEKPSTVHGQPFSSSYPRPIAD
jgi:hypothetical protein